MIKEIRNALALATKGGWDYTIGTDGKCSIYGSTEQGSMADADLVASGIANEEDAILITSTFNSMPKLLEAVKTLGRLHKMTVDGNITLDVLEKTEVLLKELGCLEPKTEPVAFLKM